jgi:hypothetical protein
MDYIIRDFSMKASDRLYYIRFLHSLFIICCPSYRNESNQNIRFDIYISEARALEISAGTIRGRDNPILALRQV